MSDETVPTAEPVIVIPLAFIRYFSPCKLAYSKVELEFTEGVPLTTATAALFAQLRMNWAWVFDKLINDSVHAACRAELDAVTKAYEQDAAAIYNKWCDVHDWDEYCAARKPLVDKLYQDRAAILLKYLLTQPQSYYKRDQYAELAEALTEALPQ